jgi:hypothetical protein
VFCEDEKMKVILLVIFVLRGTTNGTTIYKPLVAQFKIVASFHLLNTQPQLDSNLELPNVPKLLDWLTSY